MLQNLHNELLFEDPLEGLGEETWPQVHVNLVTDGKAVGGGIQEWLGMQSHLLMMTSVSFDTSWKRWNYFLFLSVYCHWDLGRIFGRKGLCGGWKWLSSFHRCWHGLPHWTFLLVLWFILLVTSPYWQEQPASVCRMLSQGDWWRAFGYVCRKLKSIRVETSRVSSKIISVRESWIKPDTAAGGVFSSVGRA